eukprot:464836_1
MKAIIIAVGIALVKMEWTQAEILSSCIYTITDIDNNYTPRTLDLSPLSRSYIQYVNKSQTFGYTPCETAVKVGSYRFLIYIPDTYCGSYCLPVFSSATFPTYSNGVWTFNYDTQYYDGNQFYHYNMYMKINWICNLDVKYFKTSMASYHQNMTKNETNYYMYFNWDIESKYACEV